MTRPPQFFDVPADVKPVKCAHCPATIYFVRMPSGRRMPVDCSVEGGRRPDPGLLNGTEPDAVDGRGISHFANCPGADKVRRPRGAA